MIDQVRKTIIEMNMLQKGDTVIIGVSGGADSVCLLHLMNRLKEEMGIHLLAIHIHHGLRGATADRDAAYVEGLCRSLLVDYQIFYRDIKKEAEEASMSVEEAGRKARYEIFQRASREHEPAKIMTAHHMNDQAETFFLNLIRGSGLKGLCGIPVLRGNILRPLLNCSREEILRYLTENEVPYMEDESNASREYLRNRIRLDLLPYMEKELNHQLIERINDTMRLLSSDEDCLSDLSEKFILENLREENARLILPIEVLSGIHLALRTRAYRRIIERLLGHHMNIEVKHLELIEELIRLGTGKKNNLPGNIIVEKVYHELYFYKGDEELIDWEVEISKETGNIYIPEAFLELKLKVFSYSESMKIPRNKYTKWFDYDKIKDKLTIRNRRDGDYIRLKGMSVGKKLKDYFIDEKIPRFERNALPLIAIGSEIIWIVGYRMSEAFHISPSTSVILEITCTQEEQNGIKAKDHDR